MGELGGAAPRLAHSFRLRRVRLQRRELPDRAGEPDVPAAAEVAVVARAQMRRVEGGRSAAGSGPVAGQEGEKSGGAQRRRSVVEAAVAAERLVVDDQIVVLEVVELVGGELVAADLAGVEPVTVAENGARFVEPDRSELRRERPRETRDQDGRLLSARPSR